jgi:ParB/RepB/Spo0J family partition protein
MSTRELELEQIHLSETGNDRETFDRAELEALAESIAAVGQLTPLLVRPREAGGYELMAGERRYRALGLLGRSTALVDVRELSDDDAWRVMLEENLVRADLDPLEECRAMWRRAERYSWGLSEVAAAFHRSRPYCADRMSLAGLCPEAGELVRSGAMTPRRAAMLAGLEAAGQRTAIRRGADLSAEAFRRLCSELRAAQDQAGLFELEGLAVQVYDEAAGRYLDELEQESDTTSGPAPVELVGPSEVAERAGVSRQTVGKWRERYADFPEPLAMLGAGRAAPGRSSSEGMPVWDWAAVEAWLGATGRAAA